MEALARDLRNGWRSLTNNPGFTALAVLTLALSIGANTTIFSWINSTLLNPIPGLSRTADMVMVTRGEPRVIASPPLSYRDFRDLRDSLGSFTGLLGYHDDWMAVTGNGRPERIYGAVTTANYFELLGIKPALGRAFRPVEELDPGEAAVVVISDDLWRNRFGADRSVLSRTLEVNRHAYTIVGVAPPRFQGTTSGVKPELWIPLPKCKDIWGTEQLIARDNYWLNVLGRLKPGVQRLQAQEEMNLQMRRIAQLHPEEHKDAINLVLHPLWRSPIGANRALVNSLATLMAVAVAVLLLACANIANLLLVRSIGRRRELAIRLSIGAGRWHLVRQLMVESLMLAFAGGLAALLVTAWSAGLFRLFVPPVDVAVSFDIEVDGAVFAAALGFALLTGMIFGALPALRASKVSPSAVLKEEGGSLSGGLHRSRLATSLVVTQIALSMSLLFCAGLFARSLEQSRRIHPGFDARNVLLVSFDLQPTGCTRQEGREFLRRILERVRTLPGVDSATIADSAPLCIDNPTSVIAPEGYQAKLHEDLEIGRALAGPDYLRTLRIPLVSGRDFSDRDNRDSQPVAIVNQALVDRYWPGREAVGLRIRVGSEWCTVVGVTRNFMWESVSATPRPFVFIPLLQNYYPGVALNLRVQGDPLSYRPSVEREVHSVVPDLPLFDITTLKERSQAATFTGRIASTVAGIFGLLSLILAAVGVYGVVSYSAGQRTREIGIRAALGAGRGAIVRMVLSHGIRMAGIGLLAGSAGSLAATRLLRSQLFGVEPTDPVTFLSVALLMGLVVLAACYIPARRAATADPVACLRRS